MSPEMSRIIENLQQAPVALLDNSGPNCSQERQFIHALREYYREFYGDGHDDKSFLFWIADHMALPLRKQ